MVIPIIKSIRWLCLSTLAGSFGMRRKSSTSISEDAVILIPVKLSMVSLLMALLLFS